MSFTPTSLKSLIEGNILMLCMSGLLYALPKAGSLRTNVSIRGSLPAPCICELLLFHMCELWLLTCKSPLPRICELGRSPNICESPFPQMCELCLLSCVSLLGFQSLTWVTKKNVSIRKNKVISALVRNQALQLDCSTVGQGDDIMRH